MQYDECFAESTLLSMLSLTLGSDSISPMEEVNMKYPTPLRNKIGLIAPAMGCNTEPYASAFTAACETWQQMGYTLDLGPNCRSGNGIGISNTPESCGKEFMHFYCETDNEALISCGGGELTCEILDYLDFDQIAQTNPKWFMGYSDNTNITFLLTTLADTASIYGPCAPAFGMKPWHPALEDAMELLRMTRNQVSGYPMWEIESLKSPEHPTVPYNTTQKRNLKIFPKTSGDTNTLIFQDSSSLQNKLIQQDSPNFQNKQIQQENPSLQNKQILQDKLTFQGRLLGGCMDCLVNLAGTKFDKVEEFTYKYRNDGIIWFLESCDLNVYGIRRAMWQMEHAGWFQHVKGFLIGRPYCYGQQTDKLDTYQAVLDIALRKQVPIIMDADIGHHPPMMPLVTGSLATVTYQNNQITIQMNQR
jgi:muramoyltetrapeptide carboxypeptidase LdcA involved in peptidoglycan recycling